MLKRIFFNRIPDIEEGATFLRKWGFIGILIGIGAGVGALALIWFIALINHYLLGAIVGYTPPLPGGEGGTSDYVFHMTRPWLLPLVTGGAGLVGGFLIWKFAPETAGIGTNAAIRAFHNGEQIKFRTIHFQADHLRHHHRRRPDFRTGRPHRANRGGHRCRHRQALKLSARERNIALAAGLGAGIAAIFKAPLAGAIIGAEIFYTEDFEVEALVPGLIASVVGYTIVGSVMGFQPIFNPPPEMMQFTNPLSLVLFAFLGVGCGLLARMMFGVYFRVERFFKRFPLWQAAAIGGVCTGLVGLAIPSVIGHRLRLGAVRHHARTPALLAIPHGHEMGFFVILLLAAFAEIIRRVPDAGVGQFRRHFRSRAW